MRIVARPVGGSSRLVRARIGLTIALCSIVVALPHVLSARQPERTYNRSWIWVDTSNGGKPLVSGDTWEVPVDYYVDPADHDGKTTLTLWGAGPWIDTPDGKYVKVYVDKRTDFKKFDKYIAALDDMGPHDRKVIEDLSDFNQEKVDDDKLDLDDTPTMIDGYIDEVDTDLDKERLKRAVNLLFVAARALEA